MRRFRTDPSVTAALAPQDTPIPTEGGTGVISTEGTAALIPAEGAAAPPRAPRKHAPHDKQRVPLAGRKEMYLKFQAHVDEVLETFLTILRSDESSNADKISAGKEILGRGLGAIPQHHVIEKTLEHKVTINSAVLKSWSPTQLAAFEDMLVQAMEAEVVEGTATDASE
jgi:hypothetical protein